jgi:glycosyltransferase involved in cell wall biosynthesis
MKILLVSDTESSAISIVARERAKLFDADLIYSTNFRNPLSILDYIKRNHYGGVLFCWRGALKEGMNLPRFRKIYRQLAENTALHCLVPDFLGLNPLFLEEERNLLANVHGYWVTSQQLFNIYKQTFPDTPPKGILHDLSNADLISKSYSNSQELKVFWVGNSQWGKRYGYSDHKGFRRYVKPLISRFKSKIPSLTFEIIDSHERKVSNEELIKRMSRARVVIQTSDSEGTGLPILEALGLGVVPVTRDVGIASEVLQGDLSKFIVEASIEDFEDAIMEALAFQNRGLLLESYQKFIKGAQSELVTWEKFQLNYKFNSANFFIVMRVVFIWMYRYVMGKMMCSKCSLI